MNRLKFLLGMTRSKSGFKGLHGSRRVGKPGHDLPEQPSIHDGAGPPGWLMAPQKSEQCEGIHLLGRKLWTCRRVLSKKKKKGIWTFPTRIHNSRKSANPKKKDRFLKVVTQAQENPWNRMMTLFNGLVWIGGFLGFRGASPVPPHLPTPKAAARMLTMVLFSFPDWTWLKKKSPARKNMTCEVEALQKKTPTHVCWVSRQGHGCDF